MKQFELNQIPERIKSGEISKGFAIQELAMYLSKNPTLFGLKKKDEDFKSEVILLLLEKGESTIELYDSNYGSFFTYFFCFVKSLTNAVTRKRASSNVKEYHSISECITGYEQNEENYSKIDYHDFERPKVPYAYKQISSEALQIAYKTNHYGISTFLSKTTDDDELAQLKEKLKLVSPSMAERILLVLALKSAYYITDKQINTISQICSINSEQLFEIIQKLRQDLVTREIHKAQLELRRNKAYYHHKKYKNRLEWEINNKDDVSDIEKSILISKYKKQTENWIKLNEKLKKGTINIRPTNKVIAEVLGICERQVSYYIKNANILGLEL